MHRPTTLSATCSSRHGEPPMTKRILASLTISALTGLLAILPTGAQATLSSVRLSIGSESKLWIDGTSNLHGWSCKASSIEAAIDVDEAYLTSQTPPFPKSLQHVQVKVPVRSLKCGHEAMDNNLYKALKADASPNISYILASFQVVPNEAADSFTVQTVGTLSVAGKEN